MSSYLTQTCAPAYVWKNPDLSQIVPYSDFLLVRDRSEFNSSQFSPLYSMSRLHKAQRLASAYLSLGLVLVVIGYYQQLNFVGLHLLLDKLAVSQFYGNWDEISAELVTVCALFLQCSYTKLFSQDRCRYDAGTASSPQRVRCRLGNIYFLKG